MSGLKLRLLVCSAALLPTLAARAAPTAVMQRPAITAGATILPADVYSVPAAVEAPNPWSWKWKRRRPPAN